LIFGQFKGDTPSACWNKIYNRIKKIQIASDNPDVLGEGLHESGTDMFGFSNPEVDKLIQVCLLESEIICGGFSFVSFYSFIH
jgi:hypothetical protein